MGSFFVVFIFVLFFFPTQYENTEELSEIGEKHKDPEKPRGLQLTRSREEEDARSVAANEKGWTDNAPHTNNPTPDNPARAGAPFLRHSCSSFVGLARSTLTVIGYRNLFHSLSFRVRILQVNLFPESDHFIISATLPNLDQRQALVAVSELQLLLRRHFTSSTHDHDKVTVYTCKVN